MKIKTYETISCNRDNYFMAHLKEKATIYVYVIWFLCLLLTEEAVFAQTDSTRNKVKVDSIKKEEENLNVFQQWIKWNNPGSLVLNYLNKQAEDYYKIRDNEI